MQLIKDASAEKLRGAYYTPPAIASFILHWGINGGKDADILEPSCGDGVFLECMRDENMLFNTVTAVEYEAADLTLLSAILRLYVISIMMLQSKSLQTKSSRMQNSNVRNSQMRG